VVGKKKPKAQKKEGGEGEEGSGVEAYGGEREA